MTTITFKNVYVKSEAVIVGRKEKEGPLGNYFKDYSMDPYFGQKSYEQAEIEMNLLSIEKCLEKANINQIDLMYGGDLISQLCTNYVASKIDTSFVGMYGACSTSALTIGHASIAIDYLKLKHVLAQTSSHTQAAERQFRYPNEYGGQKKECSTSTVTGAGSLLLSNEFSDIKVTSFTIGKVVDWNFTDVNDMGKAMVPAAYQTIMDHFKDTNRTFDDYDLVITGDLGKIGYAMLFDMILKDHHFMNHKLNDCGIQIYDMNNQDVYCGGSGCACSMIVLLSKLFDLLRTKEMKRILLVSTGCLHNVFLTQQKMPIPTIAHAVVFERS